MAATLPPINKGGNSMPSYGKPRPPPGGKLAPLNSKNAKGRRDRVVQEKNQALRNEMPMLRKKDISK